MKLKPRYQKIIEKLSQEGRFQNLSKESSYNLDHKQALGLMPIKQESLKLERNSRAYISSIESKTAEKIWWKN